jgi:L,D-transpeptidase ErfK/SrfK
MNYTNRPNCPIGSVPYVIREGDTLVKISKLYGSNLDDILMANPTIDPTNLMIGEQICIPISIQTYPICPTTNYYVVKVQDTIESIAAYFNLSPLQLVYANYGIDPNDLYENQVLCIPVIPPPVNLLIERIEGILSVIDKLGNMKQYRIINPKQASTLPTGSFNILYKLVDPSSNQGSRLLGFNQPGLAIKGHLDLLSNSSNLQIMLSDNDIQELFNLVTVGTTVTIL